MKKYFLIYSIAIVIVSFAVNGCALKTPTSDGSNLTTPGSDLVISEVFHISPEKYYTYSWIELYNPTNQNIRWYHETFLDDSTKVVERVAVSFLAKVRFYNFGNPSYVIFTDTMMTYFTNSYDQLRLFPDTAVFQSQFSEADSVIFPGQFVVIVNNKDAFDRHGEVGPFNPVILESKYPGLSLQGTDQPAAVIYTRNPFDLSDTTYHYLAAPAFWDILDANEVSLVRVSDTVNTNTNVHSTQHTQILDVVRFGNYRPTPDIFPNNNPLPNVPEWYSVARYGGYFATGNSAEDFYISNKPIPGWYSQIRK